MRNIVLSLLAVSALSLTACGHFGGCKGGSGECKMKQDSCCKGEKCEKCGKECGGDCPNKGECDVKKPAEAKPEAKK